LNLACRAIPAIDQLHFDDFFQIDASDKIFLAFGCWIGMRYIQK
jgi:hypothetical protein